MGTKLNRKTWFAVVQSITISRVLLAFTFVVLAPFQELRWFAGAAYFLALVTDFLDGRVARWGGVTSRLGAAMDVFGDRYLMVISCMYAGYKGVAFPVLAIILARELFSVAMKMVVHNNRPIMFSNTIVGGAVHAIVGFGVLSMVLRPDVSVDAISSYPFALIAGFYCVYFPVTLIKSWPNITASINADLKDS